jgi:hypothetical protein
MEQRRHRRIRARLEVLDYQSGTPAVTRDVSHDGMFVRGALDRAVGKRFVMQVRFPEIPIPLQIAAEVVRLESGQPPGIGVKLIHSSEPQRLFFAGQVDRLARDVTPLAS